MSIYIIYPSFSKLQICELRLWVLKTKIMMRLFFLLKNKSLISDCVLYFIEHLLKINDVEFDLKIVGFDQIVDD